MIKQVIKGLVKYPLIMANRIYIRNYFKGHRPSDEACEIDLKGSQGICVLAPHVDDETIGLGGTLVKCKEKHVPMHLIYMTDGSGSTSLKSKEELIQERRAEGEATQKAYGFDSLTFLDREDGALSADETSLIEDLSALLKTHKPGIIFSPYLVDGNNDHVQTSIALAKSIQTIENYNPSICLYQVNSIIPPKLVNCTSTLSQKEFDERTEKYRLFTSQWAMGFSIFDLLITGRIKNYNKTGQAMEIFVKMDIEGLNKSIDILKSKAFNPLLYKQISSEFTLIPSVLQAKESKQYFNDLIAQVIR